MNAESVKILDQKIAEILTETNVQLFEDVLASTANKTFFLDKVLNEAVHKDKIKIVQKALESGANPKCFGHKDFVYSCVHHNNTDMLILLAKHQVPLRLSEILLVRMIVKGSGMETILFFQEQGIDYVKNPWELLLYLMIFNERQSLISSLLKECVSQNCTFSFNDFFQFFLQICREDKVHILCIVHRHFRYLFTPENCQKIMSWCHGENIPIYLATRFHVFPSPFQVHLHKLISFAVSHFEKVKTRACNIIARRWIPICYDLSTERGLRMREKSYADFEKMYK